MSDESAMVSKARAELCAAFVAAQAEMHSPERNREVEVRTKSGGVYTFRYATLDFILEFVRPILAKHRLAVSWSVDQGTCTAVLIHASGESMGCPVPIVLPQNATAQEYGSALTYARRYGVTALLGLASEEDDDGNDSSGNSAKGHDTKTTRQASATTPSPSLRPDRRTPTQRCIDKKEAAEAGNPDKVADVLRWAAEMAGDDMGALLKEWSFYVDKQGKERFVDSADSMRHVGANPKAVKVLEIIHHKAHSAHKDWLEQQPPPEGEQPAEGDAKDDNLPF